MKPRRKTILCLCNDTIVLDIRRMLLEHFGYAVLPTHSAEDAKYAAANHCPDMLLMDDNHPAVDCEQVAEQLKQVCPEVITVVLSPSYHFGSRSSGGAIDRYLDKDDGPGLLMSQIEELLTSRHRPGTRTPAQYEGTEAFQSAATSGRTHGAGTSPSPE